MSHQSTDSSFPPARTEQLEAFSADLQRLHEVSNTLSKVESFDELCRQAVMFARESLGFARASIWFTAGTYRIRGSYGISEEGAVRDERDNEHEARAVAMRAVLEGAARVRVSSDVPLFNHEGTEVGRGTHAVAGLWDGERIIGALSVDDFDRPGSLDGLRREILTLYAATIGHLCTRKRIDDERLQLEARMRDAQKLESLGVLAGGIAHDFNNLLVGILGNADMALDEVHPGSEAFQYVQRIQSAAKHAAELTRQLLAYTGKVEVSLTPTDLNSLVAETEHLLRVSLPPRASLHIALSDGPLTINADRTQIRQVLINLVMNAIESLGDEAGYVRVATGTITCDRRALTDAVPGDHALPGTYVYLEVTDSGCGMDAETLRRVFEPFFTTKFTGRGLGLAAVLGIVRTHGGLVRICSEPTSGSSFQVLFPASREQPVTESPVAVPELKPFTKGTILVVDDQPSVREVAAHMLHRFGFDVITADGGRHAIALFKEHHDRVDCVILDQTMPGMDGVETLAHLKQIAPDVRVIVMSGYSPAEVKNKFDDPAVIGFIPKPFDLTEVKAELARVFAQPG